MRKLIYYFQSLSLNTLFFWGGGLKIKGTVTNFSCFMPRTREAIFYKVWELYKDTQ